jgi:hypothetical protein
MGGGISWVVLVAAFAAITALCGVLMARLCRAGSPAGTVPRGGAQAAEPAIGHRRD